MVKVVVKRAIYEVGIKFLFKRIKRCGLCYLGRQGVPKGNNSNNHKTSYQVICKDEDHIGSGLSRDMEWQHSKEHGNQEEPTLLTFGNHYKESLLPAVNRRQIRCAEVRPEK